MAFGQVLHGLLVASLDSSHLTVELLAEELLQFLLFLTHGLLVLSKVGFALPSHGLELLVAGLELGLELVFEFP